MKMYSIIFKKLSKILCFIISIILFITCEEDEKKPEYPSTTREEKIPADAIKMTPESDQYPPILHSYEWEEPEPVSSTINTAGGENSPFIPKDRNEFYFFFTPDVSIPAEQQVLDSVTGIYVSNYNNGIFSAPERVWLQDPGKLALDGAEYIQGNDMLFVTAREGYTGLHWFSAKYINNKWTN